jgi:hypothetical protein
MLEQARADRSGLHHIRVGYNIKLVIDLSQDQRQYNALTANKSIAAFLPDINVNNVALFNSVNKSRKRGRQGLSLILRLRNPEQGCASYEFIWHGHPAYIPLIYLLLFPFRKSTKYLIADKRLKSNGQQSNKNIQAIYHYSTRLHTCKGEFNTVLCGR